MTEELKPCPFCDYPGDICSSEEIPETFYAECTGKDCRCVVGEDKRGGAGDWPDVHYFKTREECVIAWNTRAEPVRKAQINDAQAEDDEEIALQFATWLRTDGPDDTELNLARAVWLEEIADRAAEYRVTRKVKLPLMMDGSGMLYFEDVIAALKDAGIEVTK
jgi:hypothetical protein